ncbi:caspase domain-containing protein [Flagelloscypha sp. PMI_526]|nr:caspase domain-containing protein [Flagelloscypha sp. PMI_526]
MPDLNRKVLTTGSKIQSDRGPTNTVIQPQSRAGLFALVVGINDYQHATKLSGCVADAQDIVSYLTSHLAVPVDHITTLYNEEANRANILKNLRRLADDTPIAKDSPIIIYYAGHGAKAVAPNDWDGTENQIEMILPWDFNPKTNTVDNEQGILDITLRSILDDLAEKKGNNITVILDSCHSASCTRTDEVETGKVTSRGLELPEGYIIKPSIDASPRSRLEKVSSLHKSDGAASHVLLAACSRDETAKEENGRGRFTSALTRYLRHPKTRIDSITYDQVINEVDVNIHGQTPHSEGFHSQRYLFNGMVKSAGCILHSIRRNQKGEFIMEAGEAHGIMPGAEFDVLPEYDPTSSAVGKFLVTEDDLDLLYTFVPKGTQIPPLAWALHKHGGYQLPIKFESSEEENANQIITQLKNTCVQDSKERFVEGSDDGDYELSVTYQNGFIAIELTDQQCLDAGLCCLPSLPLQYDKIYPVLNAAYHFFWHLRRQPSQADVLPVTLEAWQLSKARIAAKRMPIGDNLCRDGVVRIPINFDGTSSAHFGYKIVNRSTENLYVWMFSFNFLDLSIRLLHKPSFSNQKTDPCLRPGGVLPVGYWSSGTGPRTFSLPDGQDVDVTYLKLFVSTRCIDLSSVEAISPFSKVRADGEADTDLSEGQWDAYCVPVIQERQGQPKLVPPLTDH